MSNRNSSFGALLKTGDESCLPGVAFLILDSHAQCSRSANEDGGLFGARQTSVDQISLQHDVMLRRNGDDHGREFAALRLVNGDGVCQSQIQCRLIVVGDAAVLELYDDFSVINMSLTDKPYVAVENHQLIIVG